MLFQVGVVVEPEVLLQLLVLCLVPVQIQLTFRALHWLQLQEYLREQRLLFDHFLYHLVDILLTAFQRLLRFRMLFVQCLHLSVEGLYHF